ncbi:dystonin protein [Spatholobus suberectus]|nr:dystonin protein [Spatholobus suberectus]
MAEKVTIMKLKVDLECEKCYKKVKKLLSKYPQIRDQKFDEKENIVFITVVCCSPEKIRDKLCYKGGGSIKSIEIVEPPKPKPKPEPEKKKDADKPKPEPEKKKDEKPKEAEKPKPEPEKKKDGGEKPKSEPEKKKDGDKPKGEAPKKDAEKPKDKPAPAPIPVQPQVPPPVAVPVGMPYAPAPFYEGRPVGPFYEYGGPVPCYEGYYARPVYDSYGGGRPYYVSRCDQYFSDENPSGCTIM